MFVQFRAPVALLSTAHVLAHVLAQVLASVFVLRPVPAPTRARRAAQPHVARIADMSAVRMAHTATALADGRVLIAGGFTAAGNAVQSAELFDPRTERFTPLARMHMMRQSHTATTLPDGRILLAGGYSEGNAITASAELYDPATRTFTRTGDMTEPRAGHVAVALADGTVLIVGGIGPDWTFLGSAERYDPRTGRFAPTGTLSVPRESHVGVRLLDGRVLIVGGHRGRRAQIELYASAELYDPVTGRFTPTGSMQRRRHKHDAVRLADGRVLVSGGADERDDRGVYTDTELYDPRTGAFSAGPALQRGRYKHATSSVLLPTGDVLLAGGAREVERLDGAARASTLVDGDPVLAGQFSATALLPGGGVLITGGYGTNVSPQRAAWVYRP